MESLPDSMVRFSAPRCAEPAYARRQDKHSGQSAGKPRDLLVRQGRRLGRALQVGRLAASDAFSGAGLAVDATFRITGCTADVDDTALGFATGFSLFVRP